MATLNPLDIKKRISNTANDSDLISLTRTIEEISHSTDFSASPIVQYFHKIEHEGVQLDLRTALRVDLRPLIEPEIMYRLKTNQNMNWSIFGSPGSGKSLSGLYLYQIISLLTSVPVKTRNMFTNGAELYMRLKSLFESQTVAKDLVKNDVLFADENVREQTGLGAVHMYTQTTEMEIRIRQAMIHFIWVSTVLYPHQSTLVMETYDVERDPKQLQFIRRVRLLCYDNNNVLKGSIILGMPDQKIINAYMKHIKEQGLEDYFAGNIDPKAKMLREIAEICKRDPDFKKLANREQRFQYIDENFGNFRLSMGQQMRILGLCSPTREEKMKGIPNGK